jgi:hypothetical protein
MRAKIILLPDHMVDRQVAIAQQCAIPHTSASDVWA